ncbi:MAG TPA: DUF2442 domain-containing protein [Azospirillaceae bacterium]|nr:DUF2442 domain-containing protein [Azospirillaceae bacterium]
MSAIGRIIRSVAADAASQTLTLTWDDGAVTTKAMAPLIGGRKTFRQLADADLFVKATVVNDGRAVAWNDDIDMCADALWLDAHPEQNPFVQHATAAE